MRSRRNHGSIYVRGFKVNSAQVMHGPLWAKLSDHAPIVAELELA
jgi:endonuclease/exonuclease/phosphatase family metal-dependent hydrolase